MKTPTTLQGELLQFLARRPTGQPIPRDSHFNEKTIASLITRQWATTAVEVRIERCRHLRITDAGQQALQQWYA